MIQLPISSRGRYPSSGMSLSPDPAHRPYVCTFVYQVPSVTYFPSVCFSLFFDVLFDQLSTPIFLSVSLSVQPFIHLIVCSFNCPSLDTSVRLSIHLSAPPSVCLSLHPSVRPLNPSTVMAWMFICPKHLTICCSTITV